MLPLPCMLVCIFLSANGTRDRGCSAHLVFPAPSIFRGTNEMRTSGDQRPRECETVSTRHCERSEAIHLSPRRGVDCFAALAMTVDIISHSRGALRPSFADDFPPSRNRGRREDRVRAAPAVSRAICAKENAHEHTGSAEASRPSLRNGFTAYFALFPENGCFASVACASYRKLSASTAAPEPRDLTVRIKRVRLARFLRPPHPTARS